MLQFDSESFMFGMKSYIQLDRGHKQGDSNQHSLDRLPR